MSDSNLSVKITADTSSLTAELAVAIAKQREHSAALREAVQASLKMGESSAVAAQQVQQMAENFDRAAARVKALRAEIKETGESAGGLGGRLEEVQSQISKAFAFTGIGVAVEGVMRLGEAVEQLGTRAVELRTLSTVLGLDTSQLQALQHAGEEAGVSTEVLAHAGEN